MVCPAQAAPADDSRDGTMPSTPSIHHISLPAVPPQVGRSSPSLLNISGDVSAAPTSYLHLGPGALLLTSLQSCVMHVPQPMCIKR